MKHSSVNVGIWLNISGNTDHINNNNDKAVSSRSASPDAFFFT